MQENDFPFAKLVASFKPRLSSIVSGEKEGFAFRNEALREKLA